MPSPMRAASPTPGGGSLIHFQRDVETASATSAPPRDATARGPQSDRQRRATAGDAAQSHANQRVAVRSIAEYQRGEDPSLRTHDPPPPLYMDQQVRLARAASATTTARATSDVGPALTEVAKSAAAHNPPAAPSSGARKLGPRSASAANAFSPPSNGNRSPGKFQLPPLTSFTTAGAGLGIVVGLFLLCAWLARKGRPPGSRDLPAEAFAVLGRTALAGNHAAQLVRLGNKLVLLSISADGVQALAEVTEPAEVDRIAGLCASSQTHGPSAEFRQVLDQLARAPAKGFLDRSTGR